MSIAWNILLALVCLAVVMGILSGSASRFETLVLAGMIQVYAAVLYNFSLLGEVADINNHAAFVRFRALAAAQSVTGNENGEFLDQEKALADALKSSRPKVLILRISHGIVSLYALFKIVQAIL